LFHRGQNNQPPGYATPVKYLGTTTGLVGKTIRGGGGTATDREEGGIRCECKAKALPAKED